MRKDTRINRLKKLKYMLDNHDKIFPKAGFDMGTWAHSEGTCPPATLSCGTAACALGSAAFYPPLKKAGLKMGGDSRFLCPKYGLLSGFGAGKAFFGISWVESGWLFNPDRYTTATGPRYKINSLSRYITPKVVAKRVAALIKAYSNSSTPNTNILTNNYRYGLGK